MRLDPGGDELLAGGHLCGRDGERLRHAHSGTEGEGTQGHGRHENAGALHRRMAAVGRAVRATDAALDDEVTVRTMATDAGLA